ncbi:cytochrome [Streptomyces griseofuscus]|uniref:Ferredoxin n=1 Tax=Streptomyces griseofuscus TaxID=146922 RepID=A0A426RY22_9ACTN|nr:ferredoxin [Streptomyces griseofuscus]RRQ75840.1 cytochrome [Streptomyces griseofuscus]RRQ80602.1 cytochrome [Streptomyces griseofuscus]
MSWRLSVDPGQCMGSGMCAGTAPDLFVLDGDHARPVREQIPEGDERALDAADICPMQAITVRDAEGKEIGPRD